MTRLARFAGETWIPGQRCSWMSDFETAFGRRRIKRSSRSKAFGDSATPRPRRITCRASESNVQSLTASRIAFFFKTLGAAEILQPEASQAVRSARARVENHPRIRRDALPGLAVAEEHRADRPGRARPGRAGALRRGGDAGRRGPDGRRSPRARAGRAS